MLSDCLSMCSNAVTFVLDHVHFAQPMYLLPTHKNVYLLHMWIIDIVTFKYGSENIVLVVAVCVFSKWFEAHILPNKTSKEVTRWIHWEIVCRYGTPHIVRTGNGTEFLGTFRLYLQRMGICHSIILVAHPWANKLAE